LIEDLVVLARAERGTIQVRTEPVLLQHLLPKVCEQARRRWTHCCFELTMASHLPVARAEETIVEQILRNLLDNAAKYGPSDGRVEVIADSLDGWPRVVVRDIGPGVDPSEADRLFEVFYRSERTSRVSGSGIGLRSSSPRRVDRRRDLGSTAGRRPRCRVRVPAATLHRRPRLTGRGRSQVMGMGPPTGKGTQLPLSMGSCALRAGSST
jgi:hypothetical protein